MNRTLTKEGTEEASPRFQVQLAYVYYLLTIGMGIVILFVGGRLSFLVDVIASVFFLALTALFYALTKDRRRSA